VDLIDTLCRIDQMPVDRCALLIFTFQQHKLLADLLLEIDLFVAFLTKVSALK
jgi:hypothetical protein